jgi:hypothetical protein
VRLIAFPRHVSHFRRSVDGHDVATGELIADQRDSHAMSTADFQQTIIGRDSERIDGPSQPF